MWKICNYPAQEVKLHWYTSGKNVIFTVSSIYLCLSFCVHCVPIHNTHFPSLCCFSFIFVAVKEYYFCVTCIYMASVYSWCWGESHSLCTRKDLENYCYLQRTMSFCILLIIEAHTLLCGTELISHILEITRIIARFTIRVWLAITALLKCQVWSVTMAPVIYSTKISYLILPSVKNLHNYCISIFWSLSSHVNCRYYSQWPCLWQIRRLYRHWDHRFILSENVDMWHSYCVPQRWWLFCPSTES